MISRDDADVDPDADENVDENPDGAGQATDSPKIFKKAQKAQP